MDGLTWVEPVPSPNIASEPSISIAPAQRLGQKNLSNPMDRLESLLGQAIESTGPAGCPPRLADALHYTVFPGGARIRPRLCMSVAWACGDGDSAIVTSAAAAIELLHCASLVHDDLPCFDDAEMRRGKQSVHRAFGEQIAVLTGDALIVMAFETMARVAARRPKHLAALVTIIGQASGASGGIAAGQAWECESDVNLVAYHRAKTGSLFSAATMAGAAAAGQKPAAWATLGAMIGEAYQVADDIRDVIGDPKLLGKPVGRDEALLRPSACREFGLKGAVARLRNLVNGAVDSIPTCLRASELQVLIRREASRFLPEDIDRLAA